MLIAKTAVQEFLNRDLDDFTFLKDWRREDLQAELRALPVRPRITSPYPHWHHQLVCLLLCCINDSWLLFCDVGSGKTRILLETFAYKRRLGSASTAFVVALNDVNAYAWEDDAAIHAPQYRVQVLTGSHDQRWEMFNDIKAHIYVTSYPGLWTMFGKPTKNRDKKRKTDVDMRKIEALCKRANFAVYDEIHKCKNPQTLTYLICKNISRRVNCRYGATGTGFGRNPEDLWSEFLLIDQGETLGTTLGLFRAAFFNEKTGFGGWKTYEFDKRSKGLLRKTLRHRSIYYRDNEIGDMPRRRRQVHKLRPSTSLMEYYNIGLQALQEAAKSKEVDANWTRLRMICSGFVTYKGEDSAKVEIELPGNPKIESLQAFIEEVPLDRKAIIVHEFVYSGVIIERVLKDMGMEYCCLNGKVKTANKKEIYRKFRKDPEPRFLVMNWRSGGAGGNYQVAPYMRFYETPVSPIERKQCEGRIRRRNSIYKFAHYSDSIIRGSVEEDILVYLAEGRDLYKDLMEGSRRKKLKTL